MKKSPRQRKDRLGKPRWHNHGHKMKPAKDAEECYISMMTNCLLSGIHMRCTRWDPGKRTSTLLQRFSVCTPTLQKFGTWRSKCCISIKDCLLKEPPEEAPPMQILLIRLSDLYLSNSKMGNLCWLVGLKRKTSEKCPCQFRQRSGLKLHPAQLPSSHILGEVLLKGSCCWWSPTRYQVDCPRGWNM